MTEKIPPLRLRVLAGPLDFVIEAPVSLAHKEQWIAPKGVPGDLEPEGEEIYPTFNRIKRDNQFTLEDLILAMMPKYGAIRFIDID